MFYKCLIVSSDHIEDKRSTYRTFQGPYSPEMINDLMEVAGKNISNNIEKLSKHILGKNAPSTNSTKHT